MSQQSKPTQQEIKQALELLKRSDPKDWPATPNADHRTEEAKIALQSNKTLGEACELKAMEIFNFLETVLLPQHFDLIGFMIDLFNAPRETNRPADAYHKSYEWELRRAGELLADLTKNQAIDKGLWHMTKSLPAALSKKRSRRTK